MKPLLRVVFCLLLSFGCGSAIAERTITLGNGEWPPYQGRKLPYSGSASRIVTEAFASEGITVRFEYMPWARALLESKAGHLDGTFVWSKTPEREVAFHFTDPVFTESVYLLYRKIKPLHFRQLADLSGAILTGTIGYNYGPEWNKLEAAGLLLLTRVPSDEQGLRMLLAGRVDGFPVDLAVGQYLLDQIGGPDATDAIGYDADKPMLQLPMCLMISRHTVDGAELVRKFNAGLAKLKASGKLARYLKEGLPAK